MWGEDFACAHGAQSQLTRRGVGATCRKSLTKGEPSTGRRRSPRHRRRLTISALSQGPGTPSVSERAAYDGKQPPLLRARTHRSRSRVDLLLVGSERERITRGRGQAGMGSATVISAYERGTSVVGVGTGCTALAGGSPGPGMSSGAGCSTTVHTTFSEWHTLPTALPKTSAEPNTTGGQRLPIVTPPVFFGK